MLDTERNSKLHLFDTLGTIAIIDIQKNIAWLNIEREQTFTDSGFDYDIASTSNFMKVSRKQPHILCSALLQPISRPIISQKSIFGINTLTHQKCLKLQKKLD